MQNINFTSRKWLFSFLYLQENVNLLQTDANNMLVFCLVQLNLILKKNGCSVFIKL